MNRILFLLPVLFMACGTRPKTANGIRAAEEEPGVFTPRAEMPAGEMTAWEPAPEEEPAADRQAEDKGVPVAAETRNSDDPARESYEQILDEVKAFINGLNMIIKNRDYDKWRSVLSEELRKEISSREFLNKVAQNPYLKSMKIEVKTARDYFNYVVVPSRANSKVDNIEIIAHNRVKAIYINTKKETTELLYELAKTGDSWTIIR